MFIEQNKGVQGALTARDRSAKPVFMGSNPIRCSNKTKKQGTELNLAFGPRIPYSAYAAGRGIRELP
jgi:hypothetical protein